MTPIRNFGYAPSGQVTTDSRSAPDGSANIYSYGINARGRMSTVTLGGTQIAAYTYDQSKQRIIKTAANQTTHYHYDSEGRLIAETDGATGETIREYIWLGLMPIAVIAPTEDTTTGTGECDQTLVDALTAELAASIAASDALAAQIVDWDGNVAFREGKIAEMQAQLATLSGKKAEKLAEKIARWEGMITSTEAKIDDAEAELTLLDTQITDTQTALTAQQALCDGSGPVTNISGTYYLHADHLGRPQFATDSDGALVWDMGDGVTPFGEGVNLAGAFAQKLMFPGQYADAETGAEITLSHNWHRTYDPTLGRYLQADPIGLAGGLNRYAYVGGNPMGFVDPTGLKPWDWNGNGDTSVCEYYTKLAKETGCQYYKDAEKICKGDNRLVNLAIFSGITHAWTTKRTTDSEADIINNIRNGLIAADQSYRESHGTGNRPPRGDFIDEYHNGVFQDSGVSPGFYGGNLWPQGTWPNVVPFDPTGNSKLNLRLRSYALATPVGRLAMIPENQCGCSGE